MAYVWPALALAVTKTDLPTLSATTCPRQSPCGGPSEPPCQQHNLIKLVVNSRYTSEESATSRERSPSVPREQLLRSLANAGYRDWKHVILVEGGAPHDVEPTLLPLRSVDSLCVDDWCERARVVVIRTRVMSYDLHGYAALHRYSGHPLVRATAYLYTLESAAAEGDFCSRLEGFRELGGALYNQLHTIAPPASNMAVFGAAIVRSYAANFDAPLTKHQGLYTEFGVPVRSDFECGVAAPPWATFVNEDYSEPCLHPPGACGAQDRGGGASVAVEALSNSSSLGDGGDGDGGGGGSACAPRTVQPLVAFGSARGHSGYFWPNRLDMGPVNVYGTSRVRFWYPQFGLSKFVALGGDQAVPGWGRLERVFNGTIVTPLATHCARHDFIRRFDTAIVAHRDALMRRFASVRSHDDVKAAMRRVAAVAPPPSLLQVEDWQGGAGGSGGSSWLQMAETAPATRPPAVDAFGKPLPSSECAALSNGVSALSRPAGIGLGVPPPVPLQPLVVNVGLPKTATSSFHDLMRQLGVPSLHVGGTATLPLRAETHGDRPAPLGAEDVGLVQRGCQTYGLVGGRRNPRLGEPDYERIQAGFHPDTLECFLRTSGYVALSDDPWAYLFEPIERSVPHARFVMWDREEHDWVRAFTTFFSRSSDFWNTTGNVILRQALGECDASHPESLLRVYRGHRARVLDYFLGPRAPPERRQRFLRIDMADPQMAWKLCDFALAATTNCSRFRQLSMPHRETVDVLREAEGQPINRALETGGKEHGKTSRWPLGLPTHQHSVRQCINARIRKRAR